MHWMMLLLAGLGLWEIIGAIIIFGSLFPFIVVLPIVFIRDVIKAWKETK